MESSSPRSLLEHQVAELEQQMLLMSSRADDMVGKAVESLISLDINLAREVLHLDDEVDLLDLEIEQRCLRILGLMHPIATDLREIGTIMKAITDIERVGDLAVDIAKISMKIDKEFGHSNFIDARQLGSQARAMFREALAAFVKRDLELVQSVIEADDEVDALYRSMREQIFRRMSEHPEDVVSAGWMLLAIHHLERVADHAVNLAERVSFMVTGNFEQLSPSHRPESA